MTGPLVQISMEKEYEKNPDITSEDINQFRQWLSTQPHLPAQQFTDLDLILVYYCCEKSMGVSKQVLDLHYSLRTLFTAFFKDRVLDQKAKFTFDTVLFAALPAPSVFGYKMMYTRLLDPDPRNFIFNDVVRNFMMVFDTLQYVEGTWPGFVLIIDMDTATIGHITKLEVMAIKRILYFIQECMLIKLKEVHFINAPNFVDKLMMLLKPFLNKALLDIIFIHQVGSDSIYKHVPKEALPKELGGSYKSFNDIRDETMKRLEAGAEFLREENKKRVTESLRRGGKPASVEMFGIQGSFKKLDID